MLIVWNAWPLNTAHMHHIPGNFEEIIVIPGNRLPQQCMSVMTRENCLDTLTYYICFQCYTTDLNSKMAKL